MLAGISIFCFFASYCVALLGEISRLLFRSGLRRAVMVSFAIAGVFAHTLFLVQQVLISGKALPLSSSYDWYLLAAYVLAILYLLLTFAHPRQAIGVFLLPLVLVLIGVAWFFADRIPFPQTTAQQAWGSIHGLLLLIGAVTVLVGFVAGLMYLVQSYRLKHKILPSEGIQLPSLETLQRINSHAIFYSMVSLLLGLAAGAILNLVSRRNNLEAHLAWSDPVIWTSTVMLAWLIAASLFNVFYKPAQQGKKVAYLTVASFALLVFMLGVKLFVPTGHSGSRFTESTAGTSPPSVEATR